MEGLYFLAKSRSDYSIAPTVLSPLLALMEIFEGAECSTVGAKGLVDHITSTLNYQQILEVELAVSPIST